MGGSSPHKGGCACGRIIAGRPVRREIRVIALRHFVIVSLVVLTAGLVALAQASPCDQTWLGGFYDDIDYDDVVLRLTSDVSAIESHAAHATRAFRTIVESANLLDESVPPCDALSLKFSRAPPAA